jgi:hypothetical protein
LLKPPDILSGAAAKSTNFASSQRAVITRAIDEIGKTRLVPLAGLEPARCFHHLILSQARLPIPPQGLEPDHSRGHPPVNTAG